MCQTPLRVLWSAWPVTPEGRHLHPSVSGERAAGRGGSQWPAWLRRAAASRCGWGCASRRPQELSLGGRGAQTMGRGIALSRRAGLPRALRAAAALPRVPGRPPPAARRPPAALRRRRPPFPPALPPRDPADPRPGAAGGKAWWGGRGYDTRGRARENKGGMCEAESPETGRRWGPAGSSSPSRSLLFAEGPATRA